jgi:RimJ/RimL family protein N-acetyltransferase
MLERMQSITTAQLVLEPLTVAHAEAMFEVLADPEIYRYLDYPPPPSLEHLRRLYTRLESRKSPDGSQLWLNWVVRVPGQAPVGYVQATVIAPGSAWVAYVLSSKHWGRGYAHAAAQAMIEHLNKAYGVSRYLATVEAENQRSIRLLDRLAFRAATADEANGQGLSATERLYLR